MRSKLISLSVVALVASVTMLAPSAAVASQLLGAGSTLVGPLVEEWAVRHRPPIDLSEDRDLRVVPARDLAG